MSAYRTGRSWGVTIVREGDGSCLASTKGLCVSMYAPDARLAAQNETEVS